MGSLIVIIFIMFLLPFFLIQGIVQNIKKAREKEKEKQYKKFEAEILKELGINELNNISCFDVEIFVKSRQTLENFDDIKFFKENKEMLEQAEKIIRKKK